MNEYKIYYKRKNIFGDLITVIRILRHSKNREGKLMESSNTQLRVHGANGQVTNFSIVNRESGFAVYLNGSIWIGEGKTFNEAADLAETYVGGHGKSQIFVPVLVTAPIAPDTFTDADVIRAKGLGVIL